MGQKSKAQRVSFMTDLKLGDWISMQYGFSYRKFCIVSITETTIKLADPEWLISDAIIIRKTELNDRGFEYLGQGNKKWWRPFLPVFNDFIMPYSKPKEWL
jgi:hypothetical protein